MGRGAVARLSGGSLRGASSARAQCTASSRRGRARPAPRASVSSRHSQRDITAGWPSRRSPVTSTTSSAQAAWAKSCAATPTRRSGLGRPSRARMGRDRKGSTAAPAGQTPSSSPASTSRSAPISRASIRPRMRRRGWVRPPLLTVWPARSACTTWVNPSAVQGGRASPSWIRPANSSAAPSPSAPVHSSPGRPRASAASRSRLSARAWAAVDAGASPAAKGAAARSRAALSRSARSRAASAWAVSRSAASGLRSSLRGCGCKRWSKAGQSRARGPRSPLCSSSRRATSSSPARSPSRTRGCLSRASHSTGDRGSARACAARPASTPAGS